MSRHLLTKKYFADKIPIEMSAYRFTAFKLEQPKINKLAAKVVREKTKRSEDQREQLREENDPEALLKLMRGGLDIINNDVFLERALALEDLIVPRILERLKNCKNDMFAEVGIEIQLNATKNYSEPILEMLEDIWSPHVKALCCLLLGYIGDEAAIPTLMKQYEWFKATYPGETFKEGPLLALLEMDVQFNDGGHI